MMPRAAALSRTPGEPDRCGKLFERSEIAGELLSRSLKFIWCGVRQGEAQSIMLNLKYIFEAVLAFVHFYGEKNILLGSEFDFVMEKTKIQITLW